MIQYSNIIRHEGLSFEEYLKLPGYSHSYLKNQVNGIAQEIAITDKILIGKLVDAILMDPEVVDMQHRLYPIAKSIAYDIMKSFGSVISQFKRQVSFQATVQYNGLSMLTKGRSDWALPKHAVIDLKVTSATNIQGLIDFMGYPNQLWHYAKGEGVNDGYFLIHSIPLKRNFFIPLDCSSHNNEFWADKCLFFGKVAA